MRPAAVGTHRVPLSRSESSPCIRRAASAGPGRKMRRMIKKVVSVGTVVVLGVGAVVAARWLGNRPDGRIEELLASPSALERWTREREGRQAEQADEAKSPLVVQAEIFAAYLNPPAPPKRPVATPVPARPRPAVAAAPPAVVAPPLRLLGISYHCTDPAESRALVWESTGGHRWVRPGTQVGHIVIAQINPGSILCREGGATREVAMESESAPTVPLRNVPPPPAGGSAGRTAGEIGDNHLLWTIASGYGHY
jgi:hypothetical protein